MCPEPENSASIVKADTSPLTVKDSGEIKPKTKDACDCFLERATGDFPVFIADD